MSKKGKKSYKCPSSIGLIIMFSVWTLAITINIIVLGININNDYINYDDKQVKKETIQNLEYQTIITKEMRHISGLGFDGVVHGHYNIKIRDNNNKEIKFISLKEKNRFLIIEWLNINNNEKIIDEYSFNDYLGTYDFDKTTITKI